MAQKTILVGVDGSPESRAAAAMAADLARAQRARLLIVYVVPARAVEMQLPPEMDVVEHGYAAALLREFELACRRDGLQVDTATSTGPVAEALAHLAIEEGAELLVVGHRGRGAAARVLLGSVADRLVQISSRSVLVVR